MPRLDRLSRQSAQLVFLIPLISPDPRGEFNGAIEDAHTRETGVLLRLKLFSELDVRSRAEARQLLIVLLAGACVECLTTVEDGFEFPKLVRRIHSSTRFATPPSDAMPVLVRIAIPRIKTRSPVIYIDARERGTREGTSIASLDVGNEDLSR